MAHKTYADRNRKPTVRYGDTFTHNARGSEFRVLDKLGNHRYLVGDDMSSPRMTLREVGHYCLDDEQIILALAEDGPPGVFTHRRAAP